MRAQYVGETQIMEASLICGGAVPGLLMVVEHMALSRRP